jgi:hypothetical protein
MCYCHINKSCQDQKPLSLVCVLIVEAAMWLIVILNAGLQQTKQLACVLLEKEWEKERAKKSKLRVPDL